MNPDVIQFQCSACKTTLTVPVQMAGVTGPCPVCGQTITSPAATPSFGGGGFSAPAPAPMPSPGGYGGNSGLPNGPGQTAPMPNIVSPHLTPAAGAPLGGFLGQRPPSPMPEPQQPPWQTPGLGQTLMGAGAEGFPPSGHSQAAPLPQQPSPGGNFLPPRRLEGQQPHTGALPTGPAAAWGPGSALGVPASVSSFPGPRSAAAAGLSGMTPNTPTPQHMGAPVPAPGSGSLHLRRDQPVMAPGGQAGRISGELPNPVARGRAGRRQRQPKKPRRPANTLTFVLALVFLGGFLVAAGWLLREPLIAFGRHYAPGLTNKVLALCDPGSRVTTQNPARVPSPTPAVAKTKKTEPKPSPKAKSPTGTPSVATARSDSSAGAFDPNESASKPTSTTPSPADKDATSASPPPTQPLALTPTPAPEPSKPDALIAKSATTSLTEVPSTPVSASVPRGSEETVISLNKSEVKLDVPQEAKPASDALLKFLAAKDIHERLRYTLAADAMQQLMQPYYSVNQDGPIHVDTITLVRLDKKPQVGGGAHAVFGVESKAWEFPVPVMLEEGKDGFRVDWLSFVEFKDRLLERFFKGYQEGPARFHVGITRTHYFDDVVPNSDNKDAFRISPAPPNPYMATVFVDKDSPLGRDLRDKIPWGSQVWAIVELEWLRLGSQQWVELHAVPQLNWYSVPMVAKVESPKPPLRPVSTPAPPLRAVPVER